MRILIAITLLIVQLVFTAPVQAAPKGTSPQNQEKAARKACITGDYKKGTDILGDLFVETKDLTYVYNQGRCFEQNHRWEDALDRFREYQRKYATPSTDEKNDIEQHIAECKSHLTEQAPVATAPVAPPVVPAVTMAPAILPPPQTPPVTVVIAPPSSAETGQGSGLRVAGIATCVVGVTAITTGAILALKTGTLTDELNKQYNQKRAATRDSYETWGWVSYGVGAAALVAGATMYVLGWRAGKSEPTATTVAVLPTFAPGGAALFVRGAY